MEEAGLSNWSAPCMVVPKKQDPDNPREVQLRMVIDYRQLNKMIITSRAPDRNVYGREPIDAELKELEELHLYKLWIKVPATA